MSPWMSIEGWMAQARYFLPCIIMSRLLLCDLCWESERFGRHSNASRQVEGMNTSQQGLQFLVCTARHTGRPHNIVKWVGQGSVKLLCRVCT
jgi:hypothetical protein